LTKGLFGKAQFQLVARDPHGLDETLIRRVEAIPGVHATAPVLEAQADIASPSGTTRSVTLLAADPRLARFGGSLVKAYAAEQLGRLQSVVLPTSVAGHLRAGFGSPVTLTANGRTTHTLIAAVVGNSQIGKLANCPIAVTSLSYGQQLTGMPGRVSRILVAAAPHDAAQVRAALNRVAADRVDVRTAAFDGNVFRQLAMPNDSSTSLFAGISALVGFLFAFNAMLVMARERRGLIAEMRLSAFRSTTIAQVLIFDALALGIVASALGMALGDLLSRSVFQPDPGYLAIAFPIGTARVVHVSTAAVAFGCGVLAAVAAALVPLVGTYLSRAPMDAVDDDGLDRNDPARRPTGRRMALLYGALAWLAATTAILLFAPGAAVLGTGTLVVAMLLCLRPALAAALALADRLRRRISSVVPAIAIGELVSASTRSVAIAAIAAIAVFGTTAIDGARRDLQGGLDPNATELSNVADVWVTPRGDANLLATTPFNPDPVLATVSQAPGVASVGVYRGSFLDLGDRHVWVLAPPASSTRPIPPSEIVKGDLNVAVARLRAGGWAVASEAVARQLHLHIGRSFRLDTPRPTTFRLAAITTNFGWSPGAIVINTGDYRAAWLSGDASALEVTLAPGVPPAAGRRAVQAALGGTSPFSVQTAAEREHGFRATTRAGLSRLQQIATLLIVAAALAIAAAIGAMIWQRRRRLAEMKLVGIRATSLWKALLLESALLLGIGSALGAVFGLYGQQLLDRALNAATGFPVDHSIGVVGAITSLGLVVAIATIVAAVPGYYAARVPASVAFD